jgi:hypothetical protein
VVMLCFISACGGSDSSTPNPVPNNPTIDTPDYNSNFTGTWQGSLTVTIYGESATSPIRQPVSAVTKNRLVMDDPSCPSYWTVTSETASAIEPFDNCSSTTNGCTLGLGVSSGSFVRDGNGARISMAGRLIVGSGCSVPAGTYSYYAYTDLMTRTPSGSLTAQEDSLSSEIAPGATEIFSAFSANLGSLTTDR